MSMAERQVRKWPILLGSIPVAVVLATAWPGAVKGSEVTIKTILADPDQFDGKKVMVRGRVEDLKPGVSRRGNPYATFSVTDSSGAALRVLARGQHQISSTDQVEVTGILRRVKRPGRYTLYSELEASTVKKERLVSYGRGLTWFSRLATTYAPILEHPIVLIATSVVVVWISFGLFRRARRRARLERLKEEAVGVINQIARTGTLKAPATRLILPEGEVAILEEQSLLFESRAYRLYGGVGTRVGGVYVGGGVSESQQRLKKIDEGILTLTNERLIFDGGLENRSITLSDILSVNPWLDAIEVSIHRKAKSQVFSVLNPFVWTMLIGQIAAGKLAVK